MSAADRHHGEGGSFEVEKSTGERRRSGEPQKATAKGGARNKDGERVERARKTVEPGLPSPKPAPWAKPDQAAQPAPEPGKPAAKKAS